MSAIDGPSHSEECRDMRATTERARSAWEARWPDHCTACLGVGTFYNPGVRYFRDGSGEPDSYDPCDTKEEGRCHRCGRLAMVGLPTRPYGGGPVFWQDDIVCLSCGWTGWNEDDMMPMPPEGCDCEREYDDWPPGVPEPTVYVPGDGWRAL